MPAAWVSAAVGVYGAISASDAQSQANSNQQQALADSRTAAQDQLAFDKQKYYDNKPIADALGQQSVATNAQQQAIAGQQAGRAQQAWNQNQQASAGVAGTVGLNALGGQYLSPAQQQEMLGLQQALAKQGGAQSPAAATAATAPQSGAALIQQPALNSQDQARLAQLRQLQSSATTTQAPTAAASPGQGAGHWEGSGQDGYNWVADAAPAAGGAGTSSFTPEMQAELAQLTQKSQASAGVPEAKKTIQPVPTGTGNESTAPGLSNAMSADQIQQRINELQQIANQGAQQRELDKAGLVTGTAAKYAGQQVDLGEQNAQSILGDSQGLQDQLTARGDARRAEVVATAHQRANDYETKAGTQANAAIATSADAANRQLLRLGGDPNKMAAMSADTANNQQLARIGAGNQIAGINIANLNAADDQGRNLQYADQNQAFGIKSSSLDAARASRTGAKQAALGMNFGAAQQADSITGNAKDVADAKLNSLAQGSLNQTQGFANTSGSQALGAVGAGTSGVNNLNTGSNNGINAAGLVNSGTSQVVGAARTAVGATPVNYSGQIGSNLGTAASGLQTLYNQYQSGGSSSGAGLASARATMDNSEGAYPIGLGG